ncbi:MAG: hypothetical protein K6E18_00875 [Lachnospiraceae bacterium]|nr:hypothetical protein [Lachnospiraceae bacterium]
MRSLNKQALIRALVLAAAIVFLTLGLKDGGFRDVKNKAIMICYECMGIG